ncbi:hypothetical protein C3P07_18945, partial [Clostridioides difficile]
QNKNKKGVVFMFGILPFRFLYILLSGEFFWSWFFIGVMLFATIRFLYRRGVFNKYITMFKKLYQKF